VALVAVHLFVALRRIRNLAVSSGDAAKASWSLSARKFALGSGSVCAVLAVAVFALAAAYRPPPYRDGLPKSYSLKFGPNPFAPSNAMTVSGTVMDSRRLSGSQSCGDCHSEIYEEWKASAHRWSSTDPFYRAVEGMMIKEMGQEATRYCAGCHDPISLLSGANNPGASLDSPGSDEGSSCVVCHSIKSLNGTTQGNGNFMLEPPRDYLFHQAGDRLSKELNYFLIRALPRIHLEDFSAEFHGKPELCSACHKQFIDKEINNFGWVQLQNQYDDWRKGRYHVEGHPEKTLACKDCHMRLVASRDPARGQPGDPARGADGKHRSHRFIAANQAIPWLQKDPEQMRMAEEWLKGAVDVPEIRNRWAKGPAVPIRIEAPAEAYAGRPLKWQVVVTNNKVGHNFPTGPLDIIETWLEVKVEDREGRTLYHSGFLDDRKYVDKNAFFFRSLGVDEKGNLIDRHNLWDMVGQKTKRAIFVGYSDAAPYEIKLPRGCKGPLTITARLRYRKFNQFITDLVTGKDGTTFPITDLSEDRVTVAITSTGMKGGVFGGR